MFRITPPLCYCFAETHHCVHHHIHRLLQQDLTITGSLALTIIFHSHSHLTFPRITCSCVLMCLPISLLLTPRLYLLDAHHPPALLSLPLYKPTPPTCSYIFHFLLCVLYLPCCALLRFLSLYWWCFLPSDLCLSTCTLPPSALFTSPFVCGHFLVLYSYLSVSAILLI